MPWSHDTIVARLRTIEGHVRAARHLLTTGRDREMMAQLKAVHAALGRVAAYVCMGHARHCLARGEPGRAADDLLVWMRLVTTRRARGRRRLHLA